MLIEKEIISPGSYWYTDEKTGLPRRLDVTPDLTRYWQEQGNAMLSAGLTVPVPYEHDFNAHPMTPKDKLLNNAGWTKEYRTHDGKGGKGDRLFAVLDVQDEETAKKLPNTIRWTSPWINSFTDGHGKQWNNVISHIALTLRPRITKQAPFGSIAAALSMATPIHIEANTYSTSTEGGFYLSRAGRLGTLKENKQLFPRYPMAFSLFTGVSLGEGEMPPMGKKKSKEAPDKGAKPGGSETENPFEKEGEECDSGDMPGNDNVDLPPLGDKAGDVSMEEVLCDLLRALGVNCEHSGDEGQFKRNLYAAAMEKVHELTNKGMNKDDQPKPGEISKDKPPGSPGATPNPLVQQEQQPMYMSLEDINKLPDPMRGVALAMYTENQALRVKLDTNEKTTNSLRDSKLKEEEAKRTARVNLLGRLSPRVKADLDAMVANPSMALSMGEGGTVVDPMATTLSVLEKGLADIPRLLTVDASALSVQPQPTDTDMMSQEQEDKLVDGFARMMGAPTENKKAS